jgi:hypothetical protein
MLKTAHDAEEFMRTGARVSPSWPGGDLRGRIRCSRLFSRRSRQNPLQTGRAIRFNTTDVKRISQIVQIATVYVRWGCHASSSINGVCTKWRRSCGDGEECWGDKRRVD